MTARMLVTGARGLLGGAIVRAARARGMDTTGVARTEEERHDGVRILAADLADPDAARRVVLTSRADVVVHAAASTNVDWCESHPDLARRLHVDGSEAVATAASSLGARLVHVSTDAVFDGLAARYDEDAAVAPLNVYAATKLEGEGRAMAACTGALVLRLNFFGVREGTPRTSLAEWALAELLAGRSVPGFTDVRFNPLWNADLADVLLDLAALDVRGVLHVGAPQGTTKFEFLRDLAAAFDLPAERVTQARASDRAWRAPRPLCTVLDASRAEALLGRGMPIVQRSIRDFRTWVAHTGFPCETLRRT